MDWFSTVPKQLPTLDIFLSASHRRGVIRCKTTKNQAFGGSSGGSFHNAYDVFDPGVTYVDDIVLNESKSVPPGNYSLRMGISNEVTFQVPPATPEWQAGN